MNTEHSIVDQSNSHQAQATGAMDSTVARINPESAPAPLLSVRKILVPVDFTKESKSVLRHACSLAKLFGASLTLLYYHVPEHEAIAADATTILQHVAFEQNINPSAISSTVVTTGPATSRKIVRGASELSADLIVISPHLYGSSLHAIFGSSTADLVARRALCPVLIVPESESHE